MPMKDKRAVVVNRASLTKKVKYENTLLQLLFEDEHKIKKKKNLKVKKSSEKRNTHSLINANVASRDHND